MAFYQLAIVIGLLLAYLTNYFLLGTGINNWRWMFSSQAIPAFLFFFGLFFVPESPRWLVSKGNEKEALRILKRTGGTAYASAGLMQIKKSFENTFRESWKEIFRHPARRIVFIGAAIAVFSQIDGQNSEKVPIQIATTTGKNSIIFRDDAAWHNFYFWKHFFKLLLRSPMSGAFFSI